MVGIGVGQDGPAVPRKGGLTTQPQPATIEDYPGLIPLPKFRYRHGIVKGYHRVSRDERMGILRGIGQCRSG